MGRITALALAVLLSTWVVSARFDDQVAPLGQTAPVRDPAPVPTRGRGPAVRTIAVGTAVIAGSVTAADSGRPMRNVRVNLNWMGSPAAVGAIGGRAGASVALPPAGFGGGVTISNAAGVPQSFNYPIASLSRSVLTDAQGQFAFSKLAAGAYSLSASRNQYLSTNYGQKKPGGSGTTIQLTDGQQMTVVLPMMRGGVITGQVVGEDGDPISNAQVRGLRYDLNSGIKRLQPNGYASTDDRGVYRMFGLQPGDYIVAATPNTGDMVMSDRMAADMAAVEQAIASGAVQPPAAPGLPSTVSLPMPTLTVNTVGPPPGYLPTYYPNTPIPASASIVHVTGGDERSGVDVQVQLVQASSIQGSISNLPTSDLAVQVSLQNQDPMADSSSQQSTRVSNDGKFTFRNIAPGRYLINAQTVAAPRPMQIVNGVPSATSVPVPPPPRLEDSQRWWARASLSVEGQTTLTTNLTLQPGRSISGVVLFEMARPPDLTQARLMVTLSPAPGQTSISFGPPPQGIVGSDGRFTLNGVIPGKYVLRAPAGTAKSSIVAGEDTLDFPLDFTGERDITDAVLTVTDKPTELSGALTDALGKPSPDFTILLVSTDERFWTPGSRRILVSRTGFDGRYQFRGTPPGTYLLAAVTDLDNGAQYDPEFLRTLSGASMRVTLTEGAKQTQDFRLGR